MSRPKTKNKKKSHKQQKTLIHILLVFVWSIAFVLFFSLVSVKIWNSHTLKSKIPEELHGSAEAIFIDVPSSHPSAEAVRFLLKRSIVSLGKDQKFRPNDLLTRAELVTMVAKALHLQPHLISNSYCFPDVRDEWFASYICFAAKKGFIHGFPNGLFGPYEHVTNEQMQTVAMKFFHLSLPEYQAADNAKNGFMTRAQAAQVLYHVLLGAIS